MQEFIFDRELEIVNRENGGGRRERDREFTTCWKATLPLLPLPIHDVGWILLAAVSAVNVSVSLQQATQAYLLYSAAYLVVYNIQCFIRPSMFMIPHLYFYYGYTLCFYVATFLFPEKSHPVRFFLQPVVSICDKVALSPIVLPSGLLL